MNGAIRAKNGATGRVGGRRERKESEEVRKLGCALPRAETGERRPAIGPEHRRLLCESQEVWLGEGREGYVDEREGLVPE